MKRGPLLYSLVVAALLVCVLPAAMNFDDLLGTGLAYAGLGSSFVFAAAIAIRAALPSWPIEENAKLTVHIVGARHAEVFEDRSWDELSSVFKAPPSAKISIYLIGPECMGSVDGLKKVDVTTVTSAYGPNVVAKYGVPDLVIFSNADAFTCRWRRTLLFTMSLRIPMVYYFLDFADWGRTGHVLENRESFSEETLQACDDIVWDSWEQDVSRAVRSDAYRPSFEEHSKVIDTWFRDSRPIAGTSNETAGTPMYDRFGLNGANDAWLVYSFDATQKTIRDPIKKTPEGLDAPLELENPYVASAHEL